MLNLEWRSRMQKNVGEANTVNKKQIIENKNDYT